MTSRRQTLEQERAKAAWTDISEVQTDSQKKKYGTLARKLPAMIQMNGLGTALAFLLAKGKNDAKDGHQMIYRHISSWVVKKIDAQQGDLISLVRNAGTGDYRRATAEAIAYSIWLKRYAEANEMGDPTGGTGS